MPPGGTDVSEAGANPVLSRNCDAPVGLGTSQVACAVPTVSPRVKGCLSAEATPRSRASFHPPPHLEDEHDQVDVPAPVSPGGGTST